MKNKLKFLPNLVSLSHSWRIKIYAISQSKTENTNQRINILAVILAIISNSP